MCGFGLVFGAQCVVCKRAWFAPVCDVAATIAISLDKH
jgi:hypothetical protein